MFGSIEARSSACATPLRYFSSSGGTWRASSAASGLDCRRCTSLLTWATSWLTFSPKAFMSCSDRLAAMAILAYTSACNWPMAMVCWLAARKAAKVFSLRSCMRASFCRMEKKESSPINSRQPKAAAGTMRILWAIFI
ncbi:hypothetical protein [Rugamonas sp. DEMB1]|uniref:hypothetical protein n=1 Tax=Rugamonas sp. DEMB1 TaxID=3039386 RepID=UPI00244D484C|nr:hypothetical protein [Rugamonas sp. DEMB1]WGG53650.1 hypothetical protein QC826_02285 [Rugamonas sp. DEMB1]